MDLRERLKHQHLVGTAVRNTRQQKVSGCDPAVAHLRWSEMDTATCDRFFARRAAGELARNAAAQRPPLRVRLADLT